MRGGMQNAPARRCRYNGSSMPFQELVEAEGHLIDSHIMENIFDKVVEYHGRCEGRSEEHTSELQSPCNGGCRLLLEKKILTAGGRHGAATPSLEDERHGGESAG